MKDKKVYTLRCDGRSYAFSTLKKLVDYTIKISYNELDRKEIVTQMKLEGYWISDDRELDLEELIVQ